MPPSNLTDPADSFKPIKAWPKSGDTLTRSVSEVSVRHSRKSPIRVLSVFHPWLSTFSSFVLSCFRDLFFFVWFFSVPLPPWLAKYFS